MTPCCAAVWSSNHNNFSTRQEKDAPFPFIYSGLRLGWGMWEGIRPLCRDKNKLRFSSNISLPSSGISFEWVSTWFFRRIWKWQEREKSRLFKFQSSCEIDLRMWCHHACFRMSTRSKRIPSTDSSITITKHDARNSSSTFSSGPLIISVRPIANI